MRRSRGILSKGGKGGALLTACADQVVTNPWRSFDPKAPLTCWGEYYTKWEEEKGRVGKSKT